MRAISASRRSHRKPGATPALRSTGSPRLARIDPTKLEAQARQLEAALAFAEARLLQAKATGQESATQLRRLEQLYEAKLSSPQDLDAQRATAERGAADEASAKASVSQARASLQTVRTDLAKAVIHSPIDGVVLTRTAEPGATVAAQFQAPVLFKIAEALRRMELRVDVDEADVAKVKQGEDATFTVDAYPGRTFQARIQRVRQRERSRGGEREDAACLGAEGRRAVARPDRDRSDGWPEDAGGERRRDARPRPDRRHGREGVRPWTRASRRP